MGDILLLSVSTNAGRMVAKHLANKLGKLFVDIEQQVQQSILHQIQTSQAFSLHKAERFEQEIVEKYCTGSGAVIFAPYELFAKNKAKFVNAQAFYIFVPKNNLAQFEDFNLQLCLVAFVDRDDFLCNNAIKIDASKFDLVQITNEIIKKIGQ